MDERAMRGKMIRKVSRQMALRMGIVMSFFLALVGTVTSGHFSPISFGVSFAISTLISIVIGLVVPVGRISAWVCEKMKLERGNIMTRCVETLISDLIYTPLMTYVMVRFAYNMAMKQSGGQAQVYFPSMYMSSLAICFVVGFVLIFAFTPLFLNRLIQKAHQEEERMTEKEENTTEE